MYLICYYFKRGAIVIFAILLLFAVSGLQPAEAFRAKVVNIFTKDEVDATTIRPEDEELLKDWEDYWYPTYIPEGYSLWFASKDEFEDFLLFTAEDNTGEIRISTFDASSTQITHDTDNYAYKEISVGAYKGYFFSNEESQSMTAIWTAEQDLILLDFSDLFDEEELMKFAESLKYIKNKK